MAWTSPMTAVANDAFTAAQFNTNVRDNLNETCPAMASTSGAYMVATGSNAITERTADSDFIATAETTTSTSYTDLATVGPQVTVTTGTMVLVSISAAMNQETDDFWSKASFEVSGDSSLAANDGHAIIRDGLNSGVNQARWGMTTLLTSLTAGSNTFTMKYESGSGSSASEFSQREIIVVPF